MTGRASTQQVADRAAALAAPFAKVVVNNVVVSSGPMVQQILLRVKFAELDRARASQFGVNFISTGNTIGRITTGQFGAPTVDSVSQGGSKFSISDALNIFAFRPDLNFGAFVKALQNESILQFSPNPTWWPRTARKPVSSLAASSRADRAGRSERGRNHHSIQRVRYPADVRSC